MIIRDFHVGGYRFLDHPQIKIHSTNIRMNYTEDSSPRASGTGRLIRGVGVDSIDFSIEGHIVTSSQQELSLFVEQFKKNCLRNDIFEIKLVLPLDDSAVSDKVRIAKAVNKSIEPITYEAGFISMCKFRLDYQCIEGTFRGQQVESLSFTGNGEITKTFPYKGNMPTYGKHTITASGSSSYFKMYNHQAGFRKLLINQEFNSGDIIIVDSEKRTVTVNNKLVPFIGTFPPLTTDGSSASMTYAYGGSYSVKVDFFNKYI